MYEDDDEVQEESLLGLRIAFYENSNGGRDPAKHYFLGHVSQDNLQGDNPDIRNAIKVISLDGKNYRYFGQVRGGIWKQLLQDPAQTEFGGLVVCGKSPVLDYDILS